MNADKNFVFCLICVYRRSSAAICFSPTFRGSDLTPHAPLHATLKVDPPSHSRTPRPPCTLPAHGPLPECNRGARLRPGDLGQRTAFLFPLPECDAVVLPQRAAFAGGGGCHLSGAQRLFPRRNGHFPQAQSSP